MERNKKIIKVSIYGIIVNVILVIFKIIVGAISGSLAIILDAINNLSDALSSLITIIGTRLANRPANRQHPFGFGRIEYITSVVISMLILFTGFSAFEESVHKIFEPTPTDYSIYTFIILIIAFLVKLFFGLYVKKEGNKLNAQSLVASGSEALIDSIVSFSTIVSALIYIFLNLNIDGYLSVVISIFILKTGYEVLKESLGSIIGNRTDDKITSDIKKIATKYPEVLGIYDLILHDYGPDQMIGSVHIEVNDKLTARDIDKLSRMISTEVYREYGIILTIGIYATNTSDERYLNIKEKIRDLIKKYPEVLQMHGFYVNEQTNTITFDLVLDFDSKMAKEIINEIKEDLKKEYPQYNFYINQDTPFTS